MRPVEAVKGKCRERREEVQRLSMDHCPIYQWRNEEQLTKGIERSKTPGNQKSFLRRISCVKK